jgi:probable rRNA maturation factor
MSEPPNPGEGVVELGDVSVVYADESATLDELGDLLDASRWARLAAAVLVAEHRAGELTLTFVAADEMAALNAEHMGADGPTDVLSFPLDAELEPGESAPLVPTEWGPLLLGDVVVCPDVAVANAPTHAGTLDDELALLVVHGVLHVIGHDHAEPDETARMRAAEIAYLVEHHWGGGGGGEV